MDHFESQMTITSVSHTHGYNHEIKVHQIDQTMFTSGKPADEFSLERLKRMAAVLYERDGIGGSHVQKITYEGIVGVHCIPNPYSVDGNSHNYDVHRFLVTVRVSGTD